MAGTENQKVSMGLNKTHSALGFGSVFHATRSAILIYFTLELFIPVFIARIHIYTCLILLLTASIYGEMASMILSRNYQESLLRQFALHNCILQTWYIVLSC